jgi:cold shock CspA family protein
MSEQRVLGSVFSFFPERGFGFLTEGARGPRWFFHVRDAEPDAIGRRGFPVGTAVSFSTSSDGGKIRAIDVRSLDTEIADIDLSEYWEFALVKNWNPNEGFGYVQRECGDGLRFTRRSIISEGADEIVEGVTWLYFQIGRDEKEGGRIAWFACNISVCAAEQTIEDQFLAAEELPVSESVFVAPVIQKKSDETVLAPDTKNRTLKEIILRHKMKA